ILCTLETDTAFRQQRLKAWQPILTPKTVIPSFFMLGVIFIPIGIILLLASNSVVELTIDYTKCVGATNENKPPGAESWSYNSQMNECTLTFKIPDMKAPVFMYYRLTNFYQNHRRYVRSVEPKQLKGEALKGSELGSCAPKIKPGNDEFPVYYPCGLIADSFFTGKSLNVTKIDEFGPLTSSNGIDSFAFTDKGITWPSDKYRYLPTKYAPGQYVLPPNLAKKYGSTGFSPESNERFQVWMRTAGLPTFRKVYGRLDQDIPGGTYSIKIQTGYDVESFGGTKSFVLSTVSWMGGKNPFLGTAYITVGCVSLVLGFIFIVRQHISPRKLGDHTYLSWNQPSQNNNS
ncbi:Lem3/Cdc50, partial [Rozella allomycis CSF55]